MWKSLRAYCKTAESITPRISSLFNTVVTKICQHPCINLLKELRLHPKALHNYYRVNDETDFNLLWLLQYMRNKIPVCTRPGIKRITSTSLLFYFFFFFAGKTHNGLFSATGKIMPTTRLFVFDSADMKLLISGRILGSDATPWILRHSPDQS